MKKAPLKTISFYDINDMGFSAETIDWLFEVLGCGTFKVREVAMALDEEDEANLNILKQYQDSDNIQINESW
jgi:hypothetical protein